MELRKITASLLPLIFVVFAPDAFAQLSAGGSPFSLKHRYLLEEVPVEKLPSFDPAPLLMEDEENNQRKDRPYRFGKNFDVLIDHQHNGIWKTLPDGSRLWLAGISSPGAYSINLTFADFFIPEGATLFIYNESYQQIAGAFTSDNNQDDRLFATDLIQGDKIYLEYREPASVAGQGSIVVSMVTHAYRDMFAIMKNFGSSGSCNMNVNCPMGLPWSDQKRSVVMFVSGGNGFCTGALINNTLNDGTPYILTANHCGSSGFSTWVFRFNWEASGCSAPGSSPTFQSLTGAVSRASSAGSDFRLLELNNQVPSSYNAYFSGFNNGTAAPANTIGIHHPSGDIKKISFDDQPSTAVSWGGADCWEVTSWEYGTTTEPGSSGSPLYNQNGEIIGQLFGGSAACGNTLEDYYGRLSTSWNGTTTTALKSWLDPANSGVTAHPGYDPNTPTVALDAGIVSLLQPPTGVTFCQDTLTPKITLKNFGSTNLVSAQINYSLNGASSVALPWTGNLSTNGFLSLTLPLLNIPVGQNTLEIYVSSPNGTSDQNHLNDTITTTFTRISPVGQVLPLSEGIESSAFPNNGWTIDNPDGSDTWTRTTSVSGFGNSTAALTVLNYDYDGGGARDYLLSPYIDLSNVTVPQYLYFDVAYARYSNTYHDSLVVSASPDCGATWTRLYAKGNNSLSTNGGVNITGSFSPTANDWRTDSVSLGAFSGAATVQVRFENVNGFGNNLYLDNINLPIISSVDEKPAMQVGIFPNPAEGFFRIVTSQPGNYVITDLSGRHIQEGILDNDGETEVALRIRTKGVYLVRISGPAGITMEKLIVN